MTSTCIVCGASFAKVTCKKACSTVCVREKNRRWLKAYRLAHPGLSTRDTYRWRAKNPDKARLIHRLAESKRRARIRKAQGTFTHTQWLALCEDYHNLCAYCRQSNKKLTIDHIIPLARGGSHDISNIVPACKWCNDHKWAKSAQEFLQQIWP